MLILICGIIGGISQVRSTTIADLQEQGLIAPEIEPNINDIPLAYITDKDNDGNHDFNCECGYCLEGWNDSINEHINQYLIINQ